MLNKDKGYGVRKLGAVYGAGDALLVFERALWQRNQNRIAGIDEVGRGPLAGPVVAAACVLPRDFDLPGLNDSKKLSSSRREVLAKGIKEQAVSWSLASVGEDDIDRINIRQASLKAMALALCGLECFPDAVLIDGRDVLAGQEGYCEECRRDDRCRGVAQQAIIGGDGRSASIAAASILAKVERDRMMTEWSRLYPEYGFAEHKGYGTKKHLDALRRFGPCPLHRMSFAPVKRAYEERQTKGKGCDG